MSKKKLSAKKMALSNVFAAVIIVVLIVIAGVGYGLYLTKQPTKVSTASSDSAQVVTALAFAHWTAIGDANLSAVLSQYSSSASLWWYVHGSALNTTTVAYTGSQISSTWSKFFGAAGPTYWTVYNLSVTFPSSTQAVVTADVWYIIGHGSTAKTLYLPYELDYSYNNGNWVLTGDWWGLPSHPGMVYSGVVVPTVSTSTTSTTTSSTGSSSSSGYNSY